MSGVNSSASELSAHATQSAQSFQEINNSVASISEAAQGSAQGIAQVKVSAQDLTKLAAHFTEITQQFQV